MKIDYREDYLGVYGGCINYSKCLAREANNKMNCKNATVSSCFFCNEIPQFNSLDIVGKMTFGAQHFLFLSSFLIYEIKKSQFQLLLLMCRL